MATFACPQCGGALNEMSLSDRRCQGCGATLPDEAAGQPASAVETPQPSEHVAEFDLPRHYPGSPLPQESTWPEAKIRRSDHGETLAVLALLLPLVAQGVALACRFDSWGIELALGWGTVVVTALVLAVDAAFLGTIDLRGPLVAAPSRFSLGSLSSGSSVIPWLFSGGGILAGRTSARWPFSLPYSLSPRRFSRTSRVSALSVTACRLAPAAK